jgi:hypothetical protein
MCFFSGALRKSAEQDGDEDERSLQLTESVQSLPPARLVHYSQASKPRLIRIQRPIALTPDCTQKAGEHVNSTPQEAGESGV